MILPMPRRLFAAIALVLATGSCTNPRIQANIAADLQAAADEINAQRQEMAGMQEQIDSLKTAMAKQDSLIKRIMTVSGIPGL
jgi:peptidoglycan hydrolase CwlO-like protein